MLVVLRLLGITYPRELARLLRSPLFGVQQALGGLERDGLVAGRLVGRTRLHELDPRYFARKELRQYLGKLAEADKELCRATAQLRRRPRRAGKPL